MSMFCISKVNLNPLQRVPFPAWCARISSFLEGGDSFKPEVALDVYSLLPTFWHGMLPAEKVLAMGVLNKHGGQWNPACVSEMASSVHVQLKDMQNLRVCLDAAKTEPGHLDMLAPAARTMATVTGDAVRFCGKLKYSYTCKSNN